MASKSAQQEPEKAEVIEEALDTVESTLDRVKVLYEQYFLGIQKQPPTFLHTDVERKLRDLAQLQIRNTAMRYRFATLQQKFGSYNSYWRRTLRQIENGTYHRNLSKVGRRAAQTGADIPEEILAAMPKLMREQVRRDREAALALARRRRDSMVPDEELLTLVPEDQDDEPGFISEPSELRRNVLRATASSGMHVIEDSDEDFDIEAFFASVEREDDEPTNESIPAFRADAAPPAAPPPPGQPTPPSGVRPGQPTPPSGVRPGQPTPPSGVRPGQPTPPSGVRPGQPTPPAMAEGGVAKPEGAAPGAKAPLRPAPPVGTTRIPLPPMPKIPLAPSQLARPNPIAPGAAAAQPDVIVETMAGPFPRETPLPRTVVQPVRRPGSVVPPATVSPRASDLSPSTPVMRAPPMSVGSKPTTAPPLESRAGPPPGMTDADVNALYAKYVKAKEMVGESAGPGAYGKLLKTINDQAPKIMEQYQAKGVTFSVVVKDNQVIIRAKPKS